MSANLFVNTQKPLGQGWVPKNKSKRMNTYENETVFVRTVFVNLYWQFWYTLFALV